MKAGIFSLLFLFIGAMASAQTPAELQADVKKLYIAFDEIDIDKLSVMLLSTSEPTAVYDKLDGYFLNDEQKFRFVFTNAKFNYSDIKSIDGRLYCPINFRNVVRISYFKPVDVEEIQKMLKEKFHAQSVVYEKARNSFLIVYNARMVAAQTKGTWQFAFLDNTIPADISQMAITENIKKELGL